MSTLDSGILVGAGCFSKEKKIKQMRYTGENADAHCSCMLFFLYAFAISPVDAVEGMSSHE